MSAGRAGSARLTVEGSRAQELRAPRVDQGPEGHGRGTWAWMGSSLVGGV